MPEKILIVEDDPTLLRGLRDNFQFEGFHVLTAEDGERAISLATSQSPDLLLLDIMLPKINGFEVCRRLRAQKLDLPIIMLTAKGQESDIILGLNLGADDYVTKPFAIKPLLARVNAFLRRKRHSLSTTKTLSFGPFTLDPAARTLSKKTAGLIPLTPKEFALLELLLRNPARALTRDQILKRIWGLDIFVTTRSVDRCVTTLRSKIEPDPAAPRYIHTLREIGYRFDPPT